MQQRSVFHPQVGVGLVGEEHVKPYADESKFRSSVRVSEGKPTVGEIFENMKKSKGQYKYAVRRIKRCNDRIQNEKFLTGSPRVATYLMKSENSEVK